MSSKALCVSLGLVAAGLLYSAALYPFLPDSIPIHWDFHGRPDGWAPKALGAFMMPGLMAVLLGVSAALPVLAPRSFPVQPRAVYDTVTALGVGLLGYMHAVMLLAALFPGMPFLRVLLPGLLLCFALLGAAVRDVRPNPWVGVRTPWTLASPVVWERTHRVAARWMAAGGVAGAILAAAGAPLWVSLAPFAAALLYPAVYSWTLYRRLGEGDRGART